MLTRKTAFVSVFLLLLFLNTSAFCSEINLTVLDKETGIPIPYATAKTILHLSHIEAVTNEYMADSQGECLLIIDHKKIGFLEVISGADGYLDHISYWLYVPPGNEIKQGGNIPDKYAANLNKADLTIGGIVKDESGNPLEGITVIISSTYKEDDEGKQMTALSGYETISDRDGNWRCDQAYSKFTQYKIEFKHPEYGYKEENPFDYQLDELKDFSFVTILSGGLSISGFIRDKRGKPIERASIGYCNDIYPDFENLLHQKTNTEGFYSISGLSSGDVFLTAEAEGYASESRFVELTEESHHQDFEIQPGLTVKGRVVDNNDVPVQAGYGITHPEIDDFLIAFSQTDREGRFEWTSAPPEGGNFDFLAEGFMTVRGLVLTPGPEEHIIRLTKALRISGHVYDSETMKPVERFFVNLGFQYSYSPDIVWNPRRIEKSDGQFEYTFNEPNPKNYLRIEAVGYEPLQSKAFEKDEGEVTYDFALKPSDKFKSKTFMVTIREKYSNKPIEGAEITLIDTSLNKLENLSTYWSYMKNLLPQQTLSGETDERGIYTFEKLQPSEGILVIEKKGYAKTLLRDVDFKRPLEYSLPIGGSISGYLHNESGDPEVKTELLAILSGKDEITFDSNRTDKNGYFKIADLPAGRYRIFKSGRSEFRIADLAEGQDYILDWDAPGIATLQGFFISDNLPVEEVTVRGYSEDEKISAAGDTTKADGSYKLNLQYLGKYTITFSKGGGLDYMNHKREIEIKPGLNRLDVILGSKISGRAVFK